MLRGIWDLLGPGLKPVLPALAGRFLTTAPPGKSPTLLLVCVEITGLEFPQKLLSSQNLAHCVIHAFDDNVLGQVESDGGVGR